MVCQWWVYGILMVNGGPMVCQWWANGTPMVGTTEHRSMQIMWCPPLTNYHWFTIELPLDVQVRVPII